MHRRQFPHPRTIKVLASIVVGLSLGTLVPPKPLFLPLVGTVSSVVVGAVGLLGGAALYLRGPALVGATGCGCAGDCGCS